MLIAFPNLRPRAILKIIPIFFLKLLRLMVVLKLELTEILKLRLIVISKHVSEGPEKVGAGGQKCTENNNYSSSRKPCSSC